MSTATDAADAFAASTRAHARQGRDPGSPRALCTRCGSRRERGPAQVLLPPRRDRGARRQLHGQCLRIRGRRGAAHPPDGCNAASAGHEPHRIRRRRGLGRNVPVDVCPVCCERKFYRYVHGRQARRPLRAASRAVENCTPPARCSTGIATHRRAKGGAPACSIRRNPACTWAARMRAIYPTIGPERP